MSPDKYSSFLTYLSASARNFPQNKAFVIRRRIKKEVIYYSQFPSFLAKIEQFFQKNKIKPDDKILFWGMNCPEYTLLLLGSFSFARIAVPIDFRTTNQMVEKIIAKTKPKIAFVSKYLRWEFLKNHKIKVFFIENLFEYLLEIKSTVSISKLLKNKIYKSPAQIAEIVFTSGTTGVPKGVVLTQKAILSNLAAAEKRLPDLRDGRIISILPLSHMFEQIVGLLLPINFGATIFYLPRITSFRIIQAFKEYQPTHQIFVPQILKIIWEKVEEEARKERAGERLYLALKMSHFLPPFVRKLIFSKVHQLFGGKLKLIACGGAPLDREIGRNWERVGIPVAEGYGATEVTAIATFNPLDRIKLGSVGLPIAGVEISLDHNKEIYIKSESIAQGYYQEAEKTKQSFFSKGFKTGDIGEFDSEGYVYIKGRDAFKIVLPSGEKVYVEDLEAQVKLDVRVKECCVVARRLADGDKIYAYFILKENVSDDLADIVSDINSQLESKQQILSYSLWKENDFPRTPTLKIDRSYMFAKTNKGAGETEIKQTQPDNYYDVLDILSRLSSIPKEKIKEDDLLTTDLGLDSLSRAELVSISEEYLGIMLDEAKINAKTSVSDLLKMAKSAEVIEEIKLPTWHFSWWGQTLHNLFVKGLVIPIHSFLVKLRFTQKKIPKIPAGNIVIFNHPGIADAVCVLRVMEKVGSLKIVTNVTASVWEKRNIFTHWLELTMGGVPLYESGQKMIKVLQLSADLLEAGFNLLFAPQGRAQRSDIEDPFLPGIGFVVKELDRPVSIIKIKGYRDIWPAPSKNLIDCTLGELLPKKRGIAEVVVSCPIYKDWSKLTAVQIANLLEEKYKEL